MREFLNIEEEVIYNKLMFGEQPQEDTSRKSKINIDLSGCEGIMDVDKVTGNISELGRMIDTLKETSENYAFRALTTDIKVIGGCVIFLKRAVRKLLKWYIEPICFQQTVFNNADTRSIEQLTELQAELLSSVAELSRQVNQNETDATSEDAKTREIANTEEPKQNPDR